MGLLTLLAAGFVVFWALLVALTLHALLYPPRRTFAWCVSRGEPADPGALAPARPFESGSIESPGRPGEILPLWTIAGEDPLGPIVIFSHGWAESKQTVLARLGALAPVCSKIIAWDLPGHGEASRGHARLGVSERRELATIVGRVTDEAAAEGAARPIVLFGFSLGAGVSIEAAAASEGVIAGVIAEAPYRLPWTPARNVMELKGFPHRLNLRPALLLAGAALGAGPFWGSFDRAAYAACLACPLLVIHGSEDEICPIEDGRAIAEAAPQGRLVEVAGAAHLDLWSEEHALRTSTDAVRSFLRTVRSPQAAAS